MATRILRSDGTVRAITRETSGRDPSFGEILIVTLQPAFLTIRQKKRRRGFNVTYADIFRLGYMAAVRAAREEKRAKKQARR